MRPWRAAVGVTAAAGTVGMWWLWRSVPSLHEYAGLVAELHGTYLMVYGGVALLTIGVGVYQLSRALSLGAVGRKVDVVERAIRRGAGEDRDLAEALARDEAGTYEP